MNAAMYVSETIQSLNQQEQLYISRVPLNIGAVKELAQSAPSCSMNAVDGFEHYQAENYHRHPHSLRKLMGVLHSLYLRAA